jgi:hypothetical protein
MRHGFAPISIAAISLLLVAANAPPAPSLEGDWKGSGIVSNNLVADHAECRVQYTRAGEGTFSYNATCTTESGTYDLTGRVTNTSGSRYSGTVVSDGQQDRKTGRVSIIQRGKYLSVRVTSSSGSARMTLAKLG